MGSAGAPRETGLTSYAYVEAPFDTCLRLLAEDASAVLAPATLGAAESARAIAQALGLERDGHAVADDVVTVVGTFEPSGLTSAALPLTWTSDGERALLFPHLEARLAIAAIVLDPPLTRVRFTASYEPPAAVLAAGAERQGLRRMAEAALHRLANETADGLRRRHEALGPDELP
jgi:hypothetical protein